MRTMKAGEMERVGMTRDRERHRGENPSSARAAAGVATRGHSDGKGAIQTSEAQTLGGELEFSEVFCDSRVRTGTARLSAPRDVTQRGEEGGKCI